MKKHLPNLPGLLLAAGIALASATDMAAFAAPAHGLGGMRVLANRGGPAVAPPIIRNRAQDGTTDPGMTLTTGNGAPVTTPGMTLTTGNGAHASTPQAAQRR